MTTRARRGGVTGPVRWKIAALLLGGAMLITACGSSGSTAEGTPSAATSSPAGQANVTCAAVDSLRGSLESLSRTSVSPSSQGTLTTDVTNIQKQLAVLRSQASEKFSSLISELTAFVDQMQKAAAELTTNPTAAAQQASAALSRLKTKLPAAIAALNEACPKT